MLAAAAKRDDLAAFIAAAEAQGIAPARAVRRAGRLPHAVSPTPARARPTRATAPPPLPRRCSTSATRAPTSASCATGSAIYARTIRRGGAQLTAAIAKAFKADLERAEQAKRSEALLASPGRAGRRRRSPPSWTPCCARRWRRLVRELRQTLASFRASAQAGRRRAAGHGRRRPARGLLPFLEAELGLPARFLAVRAGARERRPERRRATGRATEAADADESESHALAAAIALAASARLAGDRLPPRAVRLPRQLLGAAPEGAHLAALAAALLLAAGIDVGAKLVQPGRRAQGRWTSSSRPRRRSCSASRATTPRR